MEGLAATFARTVQRRGPPKDSPTAAAIPAPEEWAYREQVSPQRRRQARADGGTHVTALCNSASPLRPPGRGSVGRAGEGEGEASPPLWRARCGRRLLLSAVAHLLCLNNDGVLAGKDDRERRGTQPPPLPGALVSCSLPWHFPAPAAGLRAALRS